MHYVRPIFRLKVKLGHEERVLKAMDIGIPNGMIARFLMKPDNETEEGIAVFESKDDCVSNGNSPEKKSFSEVMKHLESEPSCIDEEFIPV